METTIEVKFRGDGGEKYEGPERRDRATERTVQDRVEDEIRVDVERTIMDFLRTGEIGTKFIHRPAPDGCMDDDDSRDEALINAIAQIGCDLAVKATGIDDDDDETAAPDEKSMPCTT